MVEHQSSFSCLTRRYREKVDSTADRVPHRYMALPRTTLSDPVPPVFFFAVGRGFVREFVCVRSSSYSVLLRFCDCLLDPEPESNRPRFVHFIPFSLFVPPQSMSMFLRRSLRFFTGK